MSMKETETAHQRAKCPNIMEKTRINAKEKRTKYTFNQATKDFLIKSKPRLKASTYARYNFVCEKHLLPYFGDIGLNKLDENLVNGFVQSKLKSGGLLNKTPLSPKTVNDMMRLFFQITTPHHKLDFEIEKPNQGNAEIIVFTETEYGKLKSYLSLGTDNIKLGIIVAMLTGIRLGELCSLKWSDIDLESGFIRITKTMQRIKVIEDVVKSTKITPAKATPTTSTGITTQPIATADNTKPKKKTKIIIDTPKSKASIRTIPIPEILINKLKALKSHDDTYLLTNKRRYIEPRVYQRHFKSHLQACNIKDNKFHTLRHTFATMAISRGMDIKTLSILLGHTDISFTMKKYVHPNMEHKRLQIEKVAVGF